ncbi:MAG: hypothetical protein ABSA13_12560 [Beijerinckiaceae bacterium]
MIKILRPLAGIAAIAALAATLLGTAASAAPAASAEADAPSPYLMLVWDHCGVGRHRAAWGVCVSNWARGPGLRGCGRGYHLGNWRHTCIPDVY